MVYFVRTPGWIKKLFPKFIWEMKAEGQCLYLSFDDGPHPEHTSFVLDELKKYNAKATFFCVGNNVKLFPEIYRRIIDEGHAVGNHTFNHVSGKKTADIDYIRSVTDAAAYIDSDIFRPPYGQIKKFQAKLLMEMKRPFRIIMWTVLSGDFDPGINAKRCLENVLLKAKSGSVVVFHDSEKASEKMRAVLPEVLKSFADRGFSFKRIEASLC